MVTTARDAGSRFHGAQDRLCAPASRHGSVLAIRALLVTAASSAALGCTPAFDWRESRADPHGAVMLFPCKPERRERSTAQPGGALNITMQSCDTQGATFALMSADAGSSAQAREVAQGWGRAVFENINAKASPEKPPQVKAASETVIRLRGTGLSPDGRAVTGDVVTTTRGTLVFQWAVVTREPLAADTLDTFQSSLTLP